MSESNSKNKIVRRSFLNRMGGLGLLMLVESLPTQILAFSATHMRRAR